MRCPDGHGAEAESPRKPDLERARFRSLDDRLAFRNVDETLGSLRRHLGMDVAFIANFVGEERVLRYVDAGSPAALLHLGDRLPLGEGYCRHIVDGRLPQLIPDTAEIPAARALPETQSLPIGSHLSVPLVLSDGSLYGTFCCFSHRADRSLTDRDLDTLRVVADLTIQRIEAEETERRVRASKTARIQAVLDAGGPDIVFQPVVLLADGRVVGVEALSRFSTEPLRTPDLWFAEAAEVGMGIELELAALRNAIALWKPVWENHRLQLGLNCSAQTVVAGDLDALFDDDFADRIVLELTEHELVEDYVALEEALKPLRARGVKVAIDDVGSGYASLRHVLFTKPDIIKLDISLTHDIDVDLMRRSLSSAIVRFAEGFAGRVVAEGVEHEGELETLRQLGIQAAQGYHISRPLAVADFRRFLASR